MKKILIISIFLLLFSVFAQNSSPLIWEDYIENASNKINDNWTPGNFDIDGTTIVSYKIAKNGELIGVRISESSGNKEADNFALDAIKKSQPFNPLPKEYRGEFVEMEFKFTYKVVNNYNSEERNLTIPAEDEIKNENIANTAHAFNTKIPELRNYLQYINRTIKSNWNPSKICTNKIFTVILTIKKDGTLIDCKVLETFGDEEANIAAKNAITKSIPFKPLPDEFGGEYISIKYMFDKKEDIKPFNPLDYIDNLDIFSFIENKKLQTKK